MTFSISVQNENTYIYVCGLKAMEDGVIKALQEIVQKAGLNWDEFGIPIEEFWPITY
jgi:benzoyl-CoA 2,3-dioxygenase component A